MSTDIARKRKGIGAYLRALVLRIHRDEGGAFGILLLLTIWALIYMLAMLWNTGEIATRRAQVQMASNTAAHGTSTWMARVTNQESATNMAIGQSLSAEILLRAVQPTIDQVADRLTNDERVLRRRLFGNNPGQGERIPDLEYFDEILGTGAWAGNARGTQLLNALTAINTGTNAILPSLQTYLSPQQITNVQNQTLEPITDNITRIGYIQNTWIDGAAPANNAFPAAPQLSGGQGLRAILGAWVTDVTNRYTAVLNSIPAQWGIWQQFVDQTSPAMGTDLVAMSQKRAEFHELQLQFMDTLPQAAEEQRQKFEDLYKAKITIAHPVTGSDDPNATGSSTPTGGAPVRAPVIQASAPEPMEHVDSIRQRYPGEAENHFGTSDPRISIDAINVHMDFAALWHPGAPVQSAVVGGGPVHTYRTAGGQWGAIQCAPLIRYVNNRVSRDELQLANLIKQIDTIRANVRSQVFPMSWPPNPIPQLQRTIQLGPNVQFSLNPTNIAQIPKPAGIDAALSTQIDQINQTIQQFNSLARPYVNDVAGLYTNQQNLGISWIEDNAWNMNQELDTTTVNFAENTWRNNVEYWRYRVLREMGYNKGFMVLRPYALRHIPDWARGPIQQSAYQYVYQDVYDRSIGSYSSGNRIYTWNTWENRSGILGAVHRDIQQDMQAAGATAAQARAAADANAQSVAARIARQGAAIVAQEVSAEWIQRPWPYEITPPASSGDENYSGWLNVDRAKYFTYVVGATNTEETKPKFSLPDVLGPAPETIATFAQTETFNWMEFNLTYGGGDRYNQLSDYGHNVRSGSPAPWRLSTVGGWSWNARLAVSDQLPPALELNPELHQQFEAGGVPGIDPDALKALIMH